MRKHPKAVEIAKALREWATENGYIHLKRLGDEMNIDSMTWEDFAAGRRFVGSRYPDFYPHLYRLTRIPEADPRQLPADGAGHERKWSNKQLVQWWELNFPDELFDNEIQSLLKLDHVVNRDIDPGPSVTNEATDPVVAIFLAYLEELYDKSSLDRELFYQRNSHALRLLEMTISTLNQPSKERETSISFMKNISSSYTEEK